MKNRLILSCFKWKAEELIVVTLINNLHIFFSDLTLNLIVTFTITLKNLNSFS
jgi:hypothetical protein